jgi:Ca2+/Na+ antiporter
MKPRMRAPTFAFLKTGVLLLCLFAPSAWMIATIPPLWRDSDAYIQVTYDPLVVTYWGHGPAYSYVAKVPLFAGEQLERLRGKVPANRGPDSSQPSLTDTGVWLLILGQHLALCGGAYYFIIAVSHLFWIRLALTLVWASNALFYTFAHCVGSETLSMIFILLLVGKALRLVLSRRVPKWTDWYLFALLLCFCLLTRHVNLGLIALLPAAFVFSWAQNRAAAFFASGDRDKRWLRRMRAGDFRQAVIAIALGIACVATASSATRSLAQKSKFHPHSRIGFVFLWRLHFLSELSPDARGALLRKVAARSHSTDVVQLIALLEQVQAEGADQSKWESFMQRAVLRFDGPARWEKLDRALNQMAFVFLSPPPPELWHVATTDFFSALKMPSSVISSFLFATTAHYFEHQDEMAACAELATFRNSSAEQIRTLPSQHPYFRLWQGLSYNVVLLIWLVTLIICVVAARWMKSKVRELSSFSIALTAVGLVIFASTSLIHDFEPRFALTMWQLLFLSLLLTLARTASLFAPDATNQTRLY